jgi:hypothetical protein
VNLSITKIFVLLCFFRPKVYFSADQIVNYIIGFAIKNRLVFFWTRESIKILRLQTHKRKAKPFAADRSAFWPFFWPFFTSVFEFIKYNRYKNRPSQRWKKIYCGKKIPRRSIGIEPLRYYYNFIRLLSR